MARPRGFDETVVVSQAEQQFRRTGFHGTSVEDLSRATGLSKGSLYGAFGDKERLFHRVLEDYCTAVESATAAALEGSSTAGLRDWLVPDAGPDAVGCLLASATAELASEDPVVAARSRVAHETLLEALGDWVERAQQAGTVQIESDPRAVAMLLLAVQRGLEALARAGAGATVLTEAADAALRALDPAPTGT